MENVIVDGKNTLYRAIYTAINDKSFNKDVSVIVIRFIHSYLNMFKPDRFHVVWDSPSDKIWRKYLYPEYKAKRNNNKDVQDHIRKLETVCFELFKNMGIRQYKKDNMEADDLIYSLCKILAPNKVIIISSDGDLKQLSFLFRNVQIHNPLSNNKIEPIPNNNPAEIKSFMEDKSDNIKGYLGIGPVKAKRIVEDFDARNKFFNKNPSHLYERNIRLIDLTLCPFAVENHRYVMEVLGTKPSFDKKNIDKIIMKHKLNGMTTDYDRYIAPFKFCLK